MKPVPPPDGTIFSSIEHCKNTTCSDCGARDETYISHWGDLVPPQRQGFFCQECWDERLADRNTRRAVRQLGQRVHTEVEKVAA